MATQISASDARVPPPPSRTSDNESKDFKDAWDKNADRFVSKRSSQYQDPCQDFANRSIRCLHRNGGDRELCQDYFL
jgi:cytochrome c oxidase assembly protein subunit 23